MKKLVIYIHGKGGSAAEADHYKLLFEDAEVVGFDYKAQTPWEAKAEFRKFYDVTCRGFDTVILIANSLGAFYAMHSLADQRIAGAFFISPVVDMEALILKMMSWASVTQDDLKKEKEIPTSFGETLSWDYLTYVRKNPVTWNIPTDILYGEKDALTDIETITTFADRTGSKLTIMENGEHWFHTEEQMRFLDAWLVSRESLK